MGCPLGEYNRYWTSSAYAPYSQPSNASFSESRRLFVSNSRESISNSTGPNLYKAGLSIPSGTTPVRIWLWHKNSTGGSINLHVIASLTSGTGTISDIKVQTVMGTGVIPLGKCLAQAQIYPQLDGTEANVSLSTTEQLAWGGGPISNDYIAGVLMELDVTVAASATLRLRSHWSSSSGIGSWSDTMDASTDNHVRGYWSSCVAEMQCPSFDATPTTFPTPPRILRISVCEQSGVEESLYSAADSSSTANVGAYGVDLKYIIPITNGGNQSYPVYLYAQGRNVGGDGSFGAVKTSPATASFYMTMPELKFFPSNQMDQFCGISVNSYGDPTTFLVPAGGMNLTVVVANGGGATLPFNLVLTNGIAIAPEEPPL